MLLKKIIKKFPINCHSPWMNYKLATRLDVVCSEIILAAFEEFHELTQMIFLVITPRSRSRNKFNHKYVDNYRCN